MKNLITVTGATGTVGQHVVRELRTRGQAVRAFVSDAAEARRVLGPDVELAIGTFDDRAALDAAFRGAAKAYVLVPLHPEQVAWDAAAIDAAARAGVGHVVKHSVAGAQWAAIALGKWHRAGEQRLERAGVAWTHLRPSGFMTNALGWAPTIASQGAVYLPAGDGKLGVIDPRDIGAAAAAVLTSSGHEGKAYDLTGPAALSTAEQVAILGEVLGRPLRYVDVPDDAARDAMLGLGMAPVIADAMIGFMGLVRAGQAAAVSDGVQVLTGAAPRSFEAWARDHAAAFAAA